MLSRESPVTRSICNVSFAEGFRRPEMMSCNAPPLISRSEASCFKVRPGSERYAAMLITRTSHNANIHAMRMFAAWV